MKKIALLIVFMITLAACSGNINLTAVNLMAGIEKNDIAPIAINDLQESSADKVKNIADFSVDILKKIVESENTLISPLSIVSALAMTANGAEKETLSQMEEFFGSDIDDLNEFLYTYKFYLPTADKYKVSLANSIWLKDTESLTVEKEFLQTNNDYYDAEVYKAPFDESTKNDINAWVNRKTDGQIQKLLEERPPENSVMYLINALAFDAEWLNIYKDTAVREGEFTAQDGSKKTVDFMHSTEYVYIELPNAIGFSKPYADYRYFFVALLPDEGLEILDFINSIDGKTLINAVKNKSDDIVYVSMPKFTFEYGKELSETLMELGITDAFDENLADFSSLGHLREGNIFINRVIHKTKIEVNERGTKAGAVTAVDMASGSAPLTEPKKVDLDRPFFFMIMDSEFNMPFFMGVLNDIT